MKNLYLSTVGFIFASSLGMVILMFLIVVFSFVLTYALTLQECKNISEVMNLPYQYKIIGGCFLNYQDHWILKDQLYQIIGR